VPGILWLGFERYVKKEKNKQSLIALINKLLVIGGGIKEQIDSKSLVKIVRWGSVSFIVLVGVSFVVSWFIQPKSSTPPFSESLYYMVVLDASGDMMSSFDGKTKWEAARDAVQKILGDFNDHSNYGLILVGGRKLEGSNNDPCQSPSTPNIPVVKKAGEVLSQKKLLKTAVLDYIEAQIPSGGGSFGRAFSLAQFQLQDLPKEMIKTIIFITGSSDSCANQDEWEELLRKINEAKQLGINVQSEIIILDETRNPSIEEFIKKVNAANQVTEDPAGSSPVNVQVVHTNIELQQTIIIVIQNIEVNVTELLGTKAASTPRSPTQAALMSTEIATVYLHFIPTYTEVPVPTIPTFTPISTITLTLTRTETFTPKPTRTFTPTATCYGTCTPTFTPTETQIPTPTATCNGTCTPTCTPTRTRTPTPTATCYGTCTSTSTPTPTVTLRIFPTFTFPPVTNTPIPTTPIPTDTPGTSVPPTECTLTCTAGVTAICNDCSYSYAEHHTGACAGHQGVKVWCDITATP
jgi:hypothetical protein